MAQAHQAKKLKNFTILKMIPSLGFEVQMTMFEHVKVEEKITKFSCKTRDAKEKTVHILYNLILHEF